MLLNHSGGKYLRISTPVLRLKGNSTDLKHQSLFAGHGVHYCKAENCRIKHVNQIQIPHLTSGSSNQKAVSSFTWLQFHYFPSNAMSTPEAHRPAFLFVHNRHTSFLISTAVYPACVSALMLREHKCDSKCISTLQIYFSGSMHAKCSTEDTKPCISTKRFQFASTTAHTRYRYECICCICGVGMTETFRLDS